MQRRSSVLALAVLPLLLAACEKKETPPPAAPASPAAAAAPVAATKIVAFELVGPQAVGALQFDVKYTGSGRFVGDADAVACEVKGEGILSSFNHVTADKTLRAAYAAVKGFAGPMRFTECKFEGAAKAEEFTVTVKDCSDPDLNEISPPPAVKVVIP